MRLMSSFARLGYVVLAIFLAVLLVKPSAAFSTSLKIESSPDKEMTSEEVKAIMQSVALFETYTIRSGVRADWLWNRFRAQGRPLKEWPDFWRASCDASGIPCTTEAWRKIRAGTLITIPRRSEDINRDFILGVEQQQRTLNEAADRAKDEANRAAIQEALVRYRALSTIIGIIAAIFFIGMIFIAAKNHRLEALIAKLRDDYERQGKELRRVIDERDRLQADVHRLIANFSARTKESRGDTPLTPPRQP